MNISLYLADGGVIYLYAIFLYDISTLQGS